MPDHNAGSIGVLGFTSVFLSDKKWANSLRNNVFATDAHRRAQTLLDLFFGRSDKQEGKKIQ
ncbi:MAG: hypothetical protein C4B58_14950 [Deltaproteobacteria bacterium]|nr:MAG: hypothetical protein C4B58_14950 [Deltaproteobacteria bacterium]